MAKVIQNELNTVVEPWWAREKAVYIGLGMGVLWWILAALLSRYVVEPLACRDLSTANACIDSIGVSGNIATILVAMVGTVLLVRYLQGRPIVVSVASAIILWGLAGMMHGLNWYATLLWAVIFYVVSYLLFSMVTRIRHIGLVLGVSAALVVGIRVLLAL